MRQEAGLAFAAALTASFIGTDAAAGSAYQAFDGPPRARKDIAIVFCDRAGGNRTLGSSVESVDDHRFLLRLDGEPVEVYVLPGRHKFGMYARKPRAMKIAHGFATFDAEAGHTYEITIAPVGENHVAWPVKDLGVNFVRDDLAYWEAIGEGFKPLP